MPAQQLHFSSELLAAWGSPAFNERFKREVENVAAERLPLQQGLSRTSCMSDEPFSVVVLASSAQGETLEVKAAIFYSGIIAGCSCADDPTPVEPQTEYCELQFAIDRRSGEATVRLLE